MGAPSPQAFAELMEAAAVPPKGPVAVACSGGVDSMALSHLAAGWCRDTGRAMAALVVDHGLRPASAREAEKTCERLRALGIAAHLLRWEGGKPARNRSEAARNARYRLLTGWCRAHGATHLLTAHHRDDQAETFLLRLARGSGLDGLSAIPFRRREEGVWLVRPLLPWPKAALVDYAAVRGLGWVEDESNASPLYARNRMRAALAAEGASGGRIAQAVWSLARARDALETAVWQAAAGCLSHSADGVVSLDRGPWAAAPEEIRLRLLTLALELASGAEARPRFRLLKPLHDALLSGTLTRPRTLAGAVIRPDGVLHRESAAAAGPVPLTSDVPVTWDGRFEIVLHAANDGGPLHLAALGAEGWAQFPAPLRRQWAALPHGARLALPAVWREGRAVAAGCGPVRLLPGGEGLVCDITFRGLGRRAEERPHPLPDCAWRHFWPAGE